MKVKISLSGVKMLLLLMYFPTLTVERVISLCAVFAGDFSTYGGLDYYMTALTVVSLVATYAFIAIRCRFTLFKGANGKRSLVPLPTVENYRTLAIAAGILLSGGMVHTHGSIPPIQFVSYGFILASMALHTVENVRREGGGDRKWLSFAYIVAYSMAIPVVYHTGIALAFLFIPIEIVVSLGMVVLFTIMLVKFYSGNGEASFSVLPFITGLFGDALVLSMRWYEEVNIMVLIFICVVTVLWFTGTILGVNTKNTSE